MQDIGLITQWWSIFFIIGALFLPLTIIIFSNFFDKGYIFAKILGVAIVSYIIFLFGILKAFPFTQIEIFSVLGILFLFNIFIFKKNSLFKEVKKNLPIFILEEFIFATSLFFWSYIRAHQPDIHELEKFMDFGFVNSILRSEYLPPKDMWLTPFSINYYYFGHLITAVFTKLSGIPSNITFNLMLASLFGLTFTASFSIGINLMGKIKNHLSPEGEKSKIKNLKVLIGGFLTAFLVTLSGNLQTIYSLFLPRSGDVPIPFWNLVFSPQTFPNSYWYPNATRFIYNTIHEFPSYSWIVSDLHGHVLDVPFVLLTVVILLSLIFNFQFSILNQTKNFKFNIILISFLLAILYMVNVWDGIIYFLLSLLVIYYIMRSSFKRFFSYVSLIGIGFFVFSLPFNIFFKPFASGVGILCAPKFLTGIGKIGPFLFELNHCQRSPLWQLFILYGFFYFWVVSFIIFLKLNATLRLRSGRERYALNASDIFVVILIILSTLLIIIPEFIYVKDIYPAHYRANTMFKLVYQSFIMLSLSSGYIIVRLFLNFKSLILNRYLKLGYWFIGSVGLLMVFLYPYFAINSYYGNLKTYSGLDGTKYLNTLYPNDYEAILWINKNIQGQPVILEAQGDSYTDFGRVSTNTGLPTVLGWTVHEWLWRGTYDILSPRIIDMKTLYETDNINIVKNLLNKYRISYIFVGDLERQKYPNLNRNKFQSLGKIVFKKKATEIYQIHY